MSSLKEYGDLFLRLNLTELSVEEGDFKIQMKRENSINTESVKVVEAAPVQKESAPTVQATEDSSEQVSGTQVNAPLLGIFYASVGEKKAIKEGDKVSEGDVLCTIEAMKMMNEVKAPVSGVVKKVCVTDGALVEYKQILFVIE